MSDNLPKRIAVALLLAIAGCSGSSHEPTYRAGGKISFADSTPVEGGWVSFRSLNSEKHLTARGQIQPNGTFELTTFFPGDGAVEGEHQALVTGPIAFPGRGDSVAKSPPPKSTIDTRLSSYDTSELKFTVTKNPRQNWFEIVVNK